jgi:hypothetical protein
MEKFHPLKQRLYEVEVNVTTLIIPNHVGVSCKCVGKLEWIKIKNAVL